MGFWRDLFFGTATPTFSLLDQINEEVANGVDPGFFGLPSYTSAIAPAPRIDRRSAIQVPAVKRARDLIAGTLGTLPLDLYDSKQAPSVSRLFEQPERNVARSVTMAKTFEDLLFESVAWWRITEVGWHTYPTKVRRIEPRDVTVNNEGVYIEGRLVPDNELIRFDSPNDGLLIAGARAIRTCLQLDAAAARYSDEPMPLGYFSPNEGADPAEDEDVIAILDNWKSARQTRSTGYVPAALKYNSVQFDAEQIQLAQSRQHAVLEIARMAGIDPEDLGVSTTSRTYQNAETRRRDLLDFTLASYVAAVQDRLSMGDVTPNGYYAKLDLNAFLRSDTITRYQSYEVGLRVGAITGDEIRALEDRPPLTAKEKADMKPAVPALPPAPAPEPVQNSIEVSTFAAPEVAVEMDGVTDASFSVDPEKRTIHGLIVPYGKPAMSKGRVYQFSKGTLRYADPSRIKLLIQHDFTQAVGYASALEDRDDGMYGTFKVARGEGGDRALSLAEDKVLDGFSVGLGQGGKFRADATGVLHAVDTPLAETSLTPCPSFDDARVISVAASATNRGEIMEPEDQIVEGVEAPDFSAITDAITQGFDALANPHGREVISAAGQITVNEPLPYRFDGIPGEHSFSADIRAAYMSGDAEARLRLDTFMEAAFEPAPGPAVNTTTNPPLGPIYRPDLYLPNTQYNRPLWNMVSTGSLSEKTPFTIPKFVSAAGLVGVHQEGVEPTPGTFVASSQTVSPGAMSGKVEITREVWDQSGSPQADAIIWSEMVGGYYEAIEAKIAAELEAVATTPIGLGSATDDALVDAVSNVFVDLQYVRGGNRYSSLALDGVLFKALVNAEGDDGRKLLPVLGPTNAQGTVTGNFGRVMIGSQAGAAAWALGATAGAQSYLFVPTSVWCWASAPKRFTFEYKVSAIDMAVWGYTATAVLRDSDVMPIDYAATPGS